MTAAKILRWRIRRCPLWRKFMPHLLIQAIQSHLTPDLLRPRFRGRSHPLAGHCYVASEALYHLWGREHGYRPKVVRIGSESHWWLSNEAGEEIDITAAQFSSPVPYAEGKFCGFLTRRPSKRAQILIQKIKGNES